MQAIRFSFKKGAVLTLTVTMLVLILSLSISAFFRLSTIKIAHVNEINRGKKAYWNSYSALSIVMNRPRNTTDMTYIYNDGTIEISNPDTETKLARGTHDNLVREFTLKSD